MNIDEHIRQAQKKGDFENLPGQGQPIRLDTNPYAGDQQLAFEILKKGGFTPTWIEARKELEADINKAFDGIQKAWQRVDRNYRRDTLWLRAEKAFRQQALSLNQGIRNYNLQAPPGIPHMIQIDVERELVKLRRLTPIT